MARRVIFAILAVVVAYVAYFALLPVPDDVADSPWTLKLYSGAMKIRFLTTVLTPMGIKQWLDQRAGENSRATGPRVPYKDEVFDRVPVRVFADEQAEGTTGKRPAIVFYHGGGWVMGSVDAYHPMTARLARPLNAVVISVEYNLAPKYPFPGPVDDCTAATVWFLNHLRDYNVDPARVAIMGDSAGGNLAAAVAQRLTFDPKYQGLPKVKLQVLIYPCLQAFDFQTPSYQQNGDYQTVILNKDLTVWLWDLHLHGNKGSSRASMLINNHTSAAAKRSSLVQKCLSHDLIPDEFKQKGYEAPWTDFGDEDIYDKIKGVLLDPDFAPLMREDLRGLPEAYILTAEYDVLRDDGIMYAKRLEKAGVKVTWKHYKKGFHGMFTSDDYVYPMPSLPISFQSVTEFLDFAKITI